MSLAVHRSLAQCWPGCLRRQTLGWSAEGHRRWRQGKAVEDQAEPRLSRMCLDPRGGQRPGLSKGHQVKLQLWREPLLAGATTRLEFCGC